MITPINLGPLEQKISELGSTLSTITASSPGEQHLSFDQVLKATLGEVNQLQLQAGDLKDAYTLGKGVGIEEVMLAVQKANIAFQATVQVRNKIASAYESIMNMPL